MDCGKRCSQSEADAMGEDNAVDGEVIARCPRCLSDRLEEYVEAEHEDITVEVPDDYSAHPMEEVAQKLFDRVTALTEWREVKVRLWFQLQNPLLGNVSPEWMIMNGKADRLEKFIKDAEYFSVEAEPCGEQ